MSSSLCSWNTLCLWREINYRPSGFLKSAWHQDQWTASAACLSALVGLCHSDQSKEVLGQVWNLGVGNDARHWRQAKLMSSDETKTAACVQAEWITREHNVHREFRSQTSSLPGSHALLDINYPWCVVCQSLWLPPNLQHKWQWQTHNSSPLLSPPLLSQCLMHACHAASAGRMYNPSV